jgi:hypothetical protein
VDPVTLADRLSITYNGSTDPPVDPGVYEVVATVTDLNYYGSVSAMMYVNPYGPGTKKVRIYLNCVSRTKDKKFPLEAKFHYENDNDFPVFVPFGDENRIFTPDGCKFFKPKFNLELFEPGEGEFYVKFGCDKIIWELTTYESTHKTAVASDAGVDSKTCPKSGRLIDLISEVSDDMFDVNVTVYPNPVDNRVYLEFNRTSVEVDQVMLIDMYGKQNKIRIDRTGDSTMEFDMSNMPPGVYIIRIYMEDVVEQIRVVKQ